MRDLKDIINIYIQNNKKNAQKEIDYFKNMNNIDIVIKNAALAINEKGKRFSHQRRIKKNVLKLIYQKLIKNKGKVVNFKNFDDLYNFIKTFKIKGYSYLSIYDTTLRISSFLGFEPDKIYLHRGTLEGAKALAINTRKKEYIFKKDLPQELNILKDREIEDFLCIYKKYLKSVVSY
jgi:hypothetical protein